MPDAWGFKTPQARAEYLAAYDAALKLWPVPFEERDLPTPFGSTHVVVSGPEHAPPLVLLHGFMGTALMWIPNIEALSRVHRVFAVDVMGQPGKTIPGEPVRNASDFVTWLTATLDGLRLDHISLIGMSFGGWLALLCAVRAPERVGKLVLLSPGGILPISRAFVLRGALMMLVPRPFMVQWFMHWAGFRDPPGRTEVAQMCHLMQLGMEHFRIPAETRRIAALPMSDDELRGLRMPVLLLLGDREVLCDPVAALARARRLIPNFEGGLVPGSSHDMCFNQARAVNPRIVEFLAVPERT